MDAKQIIIFHKKCYVHAPIKLLNMLQQKS